MPRLKKSFCTCSSRVWLCSGASHCLKSHLPCDWSGLEKSVCTCSIVLVCFSRLALRMLSYDHVKSTIGNPESGMWNMKSAIWNLKSQIWNLESGMWNLKYEIYKLKSEIRNLQSEIRNLESEIWSMQSEIWNELPWPQMVNYRC